MKNKTNKSNFIEEKQSDRRAFIKKAGVASLGGLAVSALPMSTALAQSKKVVAIISFFVRVGLLVPMGKIFLNQYFQIHH